jgi:hypothetical protein
MHAAELRMSAQQSAGAPMLPHQQWRGLGIPGLIHSPAQEHRFAPGVCPREPEADVGFGQDWLLKLGGRPALPTILSLSCAPVQISFVDDKEAAPLAGRAASEGGVRNLRMMAGCYPQWRLGRAIPLVEGIDSRRRLR